MFPEPFVFTDTQAENIAPVVGFALNKDFENPLFLAETAAIILSQMVNDFSSCSWGYDEDKDTFWFIDLENINGEQSFYTYEGHEVEVSDGITATMYSLWFADFDWMACGETETDSEEEIEELD